MARGESTRRTSLRGVAWVHLDGFDALLSGFGCDVLMEAAERPQMAPRPLWYVLTNVSQGLEHEVVLSYASASTLSRDSR